MRLTKACEVILNNFDGRCRSAILQEGQQVNQLYVNAEVIFVLCGGRFHGWFFCSSPEWLREHTEVRDDST